MEFFVPGAKSPTRAEEIWNSTRARVEEQFGSVRDRRVFRLEFRQHAKDTAAEVGQIDPELGETVVAIFGTRDTNYICTADDGVAGGQPTLVGKHQTYGIEYFD